MLPFARERRTATVSTARRSILSFRGRKFLSDLLMFALLGSRFGAQGASTGSRAEVPPSQWAILGRLNVTNTDAGGVTVRFTRLSASGKGAFSQAVAEVLRAREDRVEALDGDIVAGLRSRNGVSAAVAAIPPDREIRDEVRARVGRRHPKAPWGKAQAANLYEAALAPEVEWRTDRETVAESVAQGALASP